MRKDTRAVFKELASQGFTAKETRKGWMIFPPDSNKGPVVVHGTPSDRKAYANFMSDLKRVGYRPS